MLPNYLLVKHQVTCAEKRERLITDARFALANDKPRIGIRVRKFDDRNQVHEGGIEITNMEEGGLFQKCGAKIGDQVMSINGTPTLTNNAFENKVLEVLTTVPLGNQINVQYRQTSSELNLPSSPSTASRRTSSSKGHDRVVVNSSFILLPHDKSLPWVQRMQRLASGNVTSADLKESL